MPNLVVGFSASIEGALFLFHEHPSTRAKVLEGFCMVRLPQRPQIPPRYPRKHTWPTFEEVNMLSSLGTCTYPNFTLVLWHGITVTYFWIMPPRLWTEKTGAGASQAGRPDRHG